MSKAFTRESDDAPEESLPSRIGAALPEGARNYLTADGAERFRAELQRLAEERASLTGDVDDPEAKRRLRALDQRMIGLEEMLSSAEIVSPGDCDPDEVCFGSAVTVREPDGTEYDYRIVGVDEIDADRGWVSWNAPIARALMKAKRGERVPFRFPNGEKTLEIVAIRSEA
jgi:transcription elongation factor GreB